MKHEEKITCAVELRERFDRAQVALLTDYRGLAAGELDRLRREVRAVDGQYRVAKNTLTRRAVGERDAGKLEVLLKGPTAIVFGFQDPVSVAKVVVRFAKEHEALTIKGGLLDGEVLTPEAIRRLAELPSRDELLAQFLALLHAPATRLLRTINQPAAQVVQLLEAVRKREGEAPTGAA